MSVLNFSSQNRMSFNPKMLKDAGILNIYVCPFSVSSEAFIDVATFKKNIIFLKEKILGMKKSRKPCEPCERD